MLPQQEASKITITQIRSLMPEATFQDHDDPHSTVYEVSEYSAGRILLDSVRRSLTSIKIRSADKYNDQTHDLLQKFGDMMPTRDKKLIEAQLDESVHNSRMPYHPRVSKV